MSTKKQTAATDSPFTPVKRTDKLTTVRLYQRTVEDTKETIAVCTFSRANRDLARATGTYSGADMTYVKIGAAGFTVHNDAEGALFFHVDSYSGAGHFRALMKLGIKHISITTFDPHHGSENTKRQGISIQCMSVDAGGFHLPYHRFQGLSDWFETHDRGTFGGTDPKVAYFQYEHSWAGHPVIWCGGLTHDGLKAEQADAAARKAKWDAEYAERRAARDADSNGNGN